MLNQPLTRENVFAEVASELTRLLTSPQGERPDLSEQVAFADLGVTSLQLAELISNLESTFEVDPFAEKVPITSVRSLGDLCSAYLSCLTPGDVADDPLDQELRAVRARALERKT